MTAAFFADVTSSPRARRQVYCAPGSGGTARPPPRVRGDKIVALSLPAWDGETAGSVASGTAATSSRLAAEGRAAS